MKNDSFKRIGEALAGAGSVYLFPHENPDGDAIGSCTALALMLRGMGKTCYALVDEKLPDNLRFMDTDGIFRICSDDAFYAPDIAMAVDCGTLGRFPLRNGIYESAKTHICIDHHIAGDDALSPELYYVDPEAAATGELVYDLMEAMEHEPSKAEAEALFAAITTDTGNFQYSNTTKKTHMIACKLYDAGIDVTRVSTELYQNVALKKLELVSLAAEKIKLSGGGKVASTVITQDMLTKTGAVMSDAEPVVDTVRSISGVEIAMVFKEKGEGEVFVSMRAKTKGNVRDIAVKFGGGGHIKAAGATVHMSLEEAQEKFIACAVESLESYQNSND